MKHLLIPLRAWLLFLGMVAFGDDLRVGWVRAGRGSGDDYTAAVVLSGKDAVYQTGSFASDLDLGSVTLSSSGYYDAYLLKYDRSGNILKAKSFGSSANEDGGRALAVSKDGSVYLTGSFFGGSINIGGINLTNGNVFLAKFDPDLNVIWARSCGGTDLNNSVEGIATDGLGVVIHGYYRSTATFGTNSFTSLGDNDLFIVRYSATGDLEWARSVGSAGREYAYYAAVDGQGVTYVTGTFENSVTFGSTTITSAGGYDGYLAAYDPSGNVLFARSFGGTDTDIGTQLAVAGDRLYLCGVFHGTANFGTNSLTSLGDADGFVAALDLSGNFNWVKQFGGTDNDQARGIAVDGSGYPIVRGIISGTATFGSQSLVSAGDYDVSVARLTPNGTYDRLWRIGGAYTDGGQGIAVDDDGQIYIPGTFLTSTTFGPVTMTAKGGYDFYLGTIRP